MKTRMMESVGKEATLFLKNNYRYTGKITNCDDKYLELLDYKSNSFHVIEFDNIKDCEVKA